MAKSKPTLFIASSVEGLPIANAVQQNLDHDANCTIWSQGVFLPSTYPLESLEEQLKNSDFGVFVFSPDDAVIMRDQNKKAVRDNVMLEFGMSLGQLGRRRSFIVAPRDIPDLSIPSDLTGITPATFELKRSDENLQAALGPACSQIRAAIEKLGKRPRTSEEDRLPLPLRGPQIVQSGHPIVFANRPEQTVYLADIFALSTEAKRILLSCSKSTGGYLKMNEAMGGGLRVFGSGELYNGSDGQEKAQWFDAIRSLHSLGLLNQHDNTTYELTKEGWMAGDRVRFAEFDNAEALYQMKRSARTILSAAKDDPDGKIMLTEDLSGFSITTNHQDLCEGASGMGPRTVLKEGLFELERLGLVRKTSSNETTVMYEVTGFGHEVAKALELP